MRLTVNLEPSLYAVAKSIARDEDCTISAAVNELLRRAVSRPGKQGPERGARQRLRTRNGLVVARGRLPVTGDLVRAIEAGDDRG